MTYATWDIETTTKTLFKRKASPFCDENWVVTHGFKKKGDSSVKEYRFGSSRPNAGWLKPVLEGTRLLVGFNIKFDLLHALQDQDNLDAWMDWVAGGGNVWDCQLAEYLLCGMGQRDQMLALDETAPRYGGNVKVDEVKALWAAGVQTQDIEPQLLSRYLCGGNDERGEYQLGDVENTEKVALAQVARARACGQLASIMMNMGSLLCTIEMERNGMFIDMPLAMTLTDELAAEVAKLRVELDQYLPKDLPFEFNWGSPKQKSAMIFGGQVYYDAYEYDIVDPKLPLPKQMLKSDWDALPEDKRPARIYSQMDEVQYVLEDGSTASRATCEAHGYRPVRYQSGKNAGEMKTKKVKVDNYDKPKGRTVKAPYVFPRLTEPKKSWAGADPGVWSTSADVIEELGNRNIPFLKALSALTAATKDLGTYFLVTDEETGEKKGMLSLVGLDNIIHHSINHVNTVTGRFSSSSPNLQNIPKGNKSKVKLVFVSRFGPDGYVVQSDFSSLEIYLQAILTKCKQLIADLKAGLDMHCLRLANTEGMPYEEVLILAKGNKKTGEPPVKEWDYKRTDSKVYSFQAAYGAGDEKIAATTGMALDRVAALRAADDARYPEINAYFKARTVEIQRNKKPSGIVYPHPDNAGIMCNIAKSSVRTPDGKLYSYLESASPSYLVKRGVFTSFSPTEIKNYEVQGEGGEWAKAAMLLAIRAFYKRRNFAGLALLVNQVHDALYGDFHKSVALEASALLHACMEAASDYMEYTFKWTLPLPVPSDTSWGASMMDDKDIPGVKELSVKYREELRQDYMNGYKPSYLH